MKCNKKMFLAIVTLLSFFVCLLGIPGTADCADYGAILVAHKSTKNRWNQLVGELHGKIDAHFKNQVPPDDPPVKLAFLNFHDGSVDDTIKNAVEDLINTDRKRRILLVPLLTFSEIYNEEILTMAEAAAASLDPPPPPDLEFVIASAMASVANGADSYLMDMLTSCAAELAGDDASEKSLLLVSYGSYEDNDNVGLLRVLADMAGDIKDAVGFNQSKVVLLKPHHFQAPNNPKKNAEAIVNLRETARGLQGEQKKDLVIAVPYLIQGDFLKDFKHYLSGIVHPPQICQQEIISHSETEAWVKRIIGWGMTQP